MEYLERRVALVEDRLEAVIDEVVFDVSKHHVVARNGGEFSDTVSHASRTEHGQILYLVLSHRKNTT